MKTIDLSTVNVEEIRQRALDRISWDGGCALPAEIPPGIVVALVDHYKTTRTKDNPLVDFWKDTADSVIRQRDELKATLDEVSKAIDSPQTEEFTAAVVNEAAHQVKRWGVDHDAGKQPQDWFWLLGFLAGKALRAAADGDVEKAKHHTISSAAALLNWHAHLSGSRSRFRPGIDPE